MALHFTTAFGDPCNVAKLNIIAKCGDENFSNAFEDIKVKNCNELDEKYGYSLEEYVKKIEEVFIADNSLINYYICIVVSEEEKLPTLEKLSPIEFSGNNNFKNKKRN